MKTGLFLLASLLGFALGQSCPDSFVADGFASVGSGTTGGGNAAPVTVTSAAARASGRGVIVIRGTIDTSDVVDAYGDKTIIGQDDLATIIGGFQNVIIKNLNIRAGAAANALASTWFDHLNGYDAADGLLDITKESDYQTVSWCKFWYSSGSSAHRLASFLGSGPKRLHLS